MNWFRKLAQMKTPSASEVEPQLGVEGSQADQHERASTLPEDQGKPPSDDPQDALARDLDSGGATALLAAAGLVQVRDPRGVDYLISWLMDEDSVISDTMSLQLLRDVAGQSGYLRPWLRREAATRLGAVCPAVQRWLRRDDSEPMKRLRAIGRFLDQVGGKDLMRETHQEFVASGGRQWSRHVEMMWAGIGSWRG